MFRAEEKFWFFVNIINISEDDFYQILNKINIFLEKQF